MAYVWEYIYSSTFLALHLPKHTYVNMCCVFPLLSEHHCCAFLGMNNEAGKNRYASGSNFPVA